MTYDDLWFLEVRYNITCNATDSTADGAIHQNETLFVGLYDGY